MLGYLSAGIGSRKAVSFEEQIMSKDKYPNIFSKSNGGLILCLLSFKYFCITHSFENWEMNILGYSPVFGQETRLNQSRASENI